MIDDPSDYDYDLSELLEPIDTFLDQAMKLSEEAEEITAEVYVPVQGDGNRYKAIIDELTGGWTSRTAPHLIPDNYLAACVNACFYYDGVVSKRPGNIYYGQAGGGNGKTGSNQPSQSMYRASNVPTTSASPTAILLVQSNGNIYKGNDTTGSFTLAVSGVSNVNFCTYTQMADPDATIGAGNTVVFICDGQNIPKIWNGTNFTNVRTGSSGGTNWLPTDPYGSNITPQYCIDWGGHLVYAGQPTDPGALYIMDTFQPERGNGYSTTLSSGSQLFPFYPDERMGTLGVITGLGVLGPYLIIFYTNGIVVAANSGTYGATQYSFVTISRGVGAVAPRSLIPMGTYIAFFGGDKFYCTDGQGVYPIPDELPTIYDNNAKSVRPPSIKNQKTVYGVRHGDELIWSFDSSGTGENDQCVMFDQSAQTTQGGWFPGMIRGGAWSLWSSGMPIACAVDCRMPGDIIGTMYWGSSQNDLIAQHDAVTTTSGASANYSDFGQPIAFEARTKVLLFDDPAASKTVQAVYITANLDPIGSGYTVSPQAYIIIDNIQGTAPSQTLAPQPTQYTIAPNGVAWDTQYWDTFFWGSGIITTYPSTKKVWFGQNMIGRSVQLGILETSVYPFGISGFEVVCNLTPPTNQ